jgi:DNA-binding protein H-NS
MATLEELLAQRNALDRQIADTQRSRRAEAIARIHELMAGHGLTPADLVAPKTAKKLTGGGGQKVAAKYRHPTSGTTWSGRGLTPKWLASELAAGKTLQDFAI